MSMPARVDETVAENGADRRPALPAAPGGDGDALRAHASTLGNAAFADTLTLRPGRFRASVPPGVLARRSAPVRGDKGAPANAFASPGGGVLARTATLARQVPPRSLGEIADEMRHIEDVLRAAEEKGRHLIRERAPGVTRGMNRRGEVLKALDALGRGTGQTAEEARKLAAEIRGLNREVQELGRERRRVKEAARAAQRAAARPPVPSGSLRSGSPPPTPTKPGSGKASGGSAKGGAGPGTLSLGVGIALGQLHERARARRIAERAKGEGYVPQGNRGGILDRIGDLVHDPTGEGERRVPTATRLNMAKWRQKAREHFRGHKPGDTVVYRWDDKEKDRYLVYMLGVDGKWFILSEGNGLLGARRFSLRLRPGVRDHFSKHGLNTPHPASAEVPDINMVISPTVSDSEVERKMREPEVV